MGCGAGVHRGCRAVLVELEALDEVGFGAGHGEATQLQLHLQLSHLGKQRPVIPQDHTTAHTASFGEIWTQTQTVWAKTFLESSR